ncbi:glycosyltransferase family 87 protein [Mesorhizobium sp. NPDC059054]|uniref:glycosyltransferase family 87 protein n=1 Tax=Mesorhizobium sp. NPDC059054 TaxID=3346711 RepID=UPI0036781EAA
MSISKPLYECSGLILWSLALFTVLIIAALKPEVRSVLVAYDFGTQSFYSHSTLYNLESTMGYLYAPGFAALYAPFYALGPAVGGLLWRGLGVGLLTFVVFKQVKRLDTANTTEIGSLAMFIAIPLSLGAVRNGQATILLTAACWLLTLNALDRRRGATLLWALIALLVKPTAIVMVLLVGALRPKLIPHLVIAILLVFAIPYAFAPADYVTSQNIEFVRLLSSMSSNRSSAFEPADFTGVLTAFGIEVSSSVAMLVRMLAAGMMLATVVWIDRRAGRHRAFAIFLMATCYMTVFNPRVESNTYVMLAVPLAVAISYLKLRIPGQPLVSACGILVFIAGLTGAHAHIHTMLNPWFKPLVMTLVAIPVFVWLLEVALHPRQKSAPSIRSV